VRDPRNSYASPFGSYASDAAESRRAVQPSEAEWRRALTLIGQLEARNGALEQAQVELKQQLGALDEQRRGLEQERGALQARLQQLGAELEQLRSRPAQQPEAQPDAAKDELQQRYLRLVADLDNLRRRQSTQIAHEVASAKAQLFTDLLPVLDMLGKARSAPVQSVDALREGVAAVEQQFLAALQKQGVERLDPRGGPFDPQQHEAIAVVPTAAQPEGHLVEIFRPGYRLGDRLLRPAQVSVATAPADGGRT
jgi:molecular chaperone GrpE